MVRFPEIFFLLDPSYHSHFGYFHCVRLYGFLILLVRDGYEVEGIKTKWLNVSRDALSAARRAG